MSTAYYFTNTEKRKSWEEFLSAYKALGTSLLSSVQGIPTLPSLTDTKQDFLENLERALKEPTFATDSNFDFHIGTFSSGHFSFSSELPVRDIPSLRAFAFQHPELSIEDEYRSGISLDNLCKLIKDSM